MVVLLLSLGPGSGVQSDGTGKERVGTGVCGFVGAALMVDPWLMPTRRRMSVCLSYSWGSLWTFLLYMSSKWVIDYELAPRMSD